MSAADPALWAFLSTRASYPAKLMQGPGPAGEVLRAIVTAGLRVPDHGALCPWRILALHRPALERLAALAEARGLARGLPPDQVEKGRGQFARSPFALAVILSPKKTEKVPELEQILSTGALCLSLLNAAAAQGFAAQWLTGWPAHDPVFGGQALGLTPGEQVAGFLHIGQPSAPAPEGRPRPALAEVFKELKA
jgi:nitroreductase